jgi:hypothetical protein
MQLKTNSNINLGKVLSGEGASSASQELSEASGGLDFAKLLASNSEAGMTGDVGIIDELVALNQSNIEKGTGDETLELETLVGTKVSSEKVDKLSGSEEALPVKSNVDKSLAKILVNNEQDTLSIKKDIASGEVVAQEDSKISLDKLLKNQKSVEDHPKNMDESSSAKPISKAVKEGAVNLKSLLEVKQKDVLVSRDSVEQIDSSKVDRKAKNDITKDQKVISSGETNIALMEFSKKLNNTKSSRPYQKEVKALNQSLIKSPVHQELVDNNQKMSSEDGSFNSQEGKTEFFNFEQVDLKNSESQVSDVKGQKTIDLSHMKADSKSALIKEVSNYIEQSYVGGKDGIDLLVKHEELGDFRVMAQKTGLGQQVSLEITTGSREAHQFFAQHETELMKTLQDNGVKLSQMKIVSKSETVMIGDTKQGQFDTSNHESRGDHRHGEQGSLSQRQQSQGRGSDRRKQLWQDAQNFREQQLAA